MLDAVAAPGPSPAEPDPRAVSIGRVATVADDVLLVTTPEPTSMTDAYATIKVLATQQQRRAVLMVVNQVGRPGEGRAIRSQLAPGGLFVAHLPTIGNGVQARLYRGSYDQDPTHIYRPAGREFRAFERGCVTRSTRPVCSSWRPIA